MWNRVNLDHYFSLIKYGMSQGLTKMILKSIRSPNKFAQIFFEPIFDVKMKPKTSLSELKEIDSAFSILVNQLMNSSGFQHFSSEITTSQHVDCTLGEMFRKYGSDKANYGYDKIYSEIISSILSQNKEPLIVEIGLGTNNIDTPSNMGRFGKPGASLRAFKAYHPKLTMIGGDVDHRILFSEPRISTYHVDQLNPDSLAKFFGYCQSPDLIIDDGLHTFTANMNTVLAASLVIKPCGYIVVEDIEPTDRAMAIWYLFASLLGESFNFTIHRSGPSFLFVAQKKSKDDFQLDGSS